MPSRAVARRWELAAQLRALRLERKLTLDDVARLLYCSPAKVSRLENGRRGAQLDDVRRLALIYGLSAERTRHLMSLAEDVRAGPIWQIADASVAVQKYLELEAAAHTIHWAESSRIPGLLQIPGYTTALLTRNLPILTGVDQPVESWVTLRPSRQRRLLEEPVLHLEVVIDEAAVRRAVGGPAVMAAQVANLVQLSALQNVRLQLIPFNAGAHPGMEGPIVILGFTSEQRLTDSVFVEGLVGHLFVEDRPSVVRYTQAFERLAGLALSPEGTREALTIVAQEWQQKAAWIDGTDDRGELGA